MKRLFSLAVLAAAFFSFAGAADADSPPAAVEGFTFVKTVGAISEYTFDANGLDVLLLPDHSSPTLTFMVTYRVGSRNEGLGVTGATHLLEHLMFKGSPEFNRAKGNSIDQYLESIGGRYNATTSRDRTNYYANIASDHLEGYMAIEADRMRHLWLRESDRQSEMTVVRNEFERGENSPYQALIKEIYAAAFIAHPYHHPTIGWRSDIENVPIEKLRAFYDTFYWPNNATVSVVGDCEPARALALIKQYYGAYPRSPEPIPTVYTVEPEQTGPRHLTIRRAGHSGLVAVGYKTPAGTDPDFAAVQILDAILADGKNSRLYHALTDKNLTVDVQTYLAFNRDPALEIIFAPLAAGVGHEQVEKIIFAEVERLKHDGVTAEEVKTAAAKILADAAFQRDGSFAMAGNLNDAIAVGDWTLYYGLEDAIRLVTPRDVQRVAQKYFDADQSTTGWFIPLAAPAPARAK